MKTSVRKLALEVSHLSSAHQIAFARRWAGDLVDRGDSALVGRLMRVLSAKCGVGGRDARKITRWMESRLAKDFDLTPKRLASEYRYYARMDRRMEGYLVRLAQGVKQRLRMRRRRAAGEETDEGCR